MTAVHRVTQLLAAAFILASASGAFAADDGVWTVSKSSGEVWLSSTGAQPASLTQEETLKPGDTIRTGTQRARASAARRGNDPDLAEFGGRPADREEGRAVDDDPAAGRLDPARGRKAQRQAFRGRDPLPRRRGQGHAVSRHRERREHQRRRDPRPGRGRRFQVGPDRAGHAGPARDHFCAGQTGSVARADRAPSTRSSKASRAQPRSNACRCPKPASPRPATPRTDQSSTTPAPTRPSPASRASRRRSAKSG